MNLEQLTILVVVSALDIGLGVAVYRKSGNSRIHRLFALAALGMVAYMVVNFMCDQPVFVQYALLLNRMAVAMGLLAGVPLFAFGVSFPESRPRLSNGWRVGVGSLGLLAAIAMFTDLIVKNVQVRPWGTNVTQGALFPYFSVWMLIVAVSFVASVWIRYREASGNVRTQFKYLGMGFALLLFASLLISSVLPVLTGSNELLYLMPLATLLFLGPTGYAVVRHRLLDVRFVVLRGIAYALLLVLFGGLWVLFLEVTRASVAARFSVDSRLLTLLTGLTLVLGFQPLRLALERVTDNYFYGKTFDPDRLLQRLGRAMATTLDRHKLSTMLSKELCQEMRLSLASVVYDQQEKPVHFDAGLGLSDSDVLRLMAIQTDGRIIVADDLDPGTPERDVMRDIGVEVLAPLLGDGAWLGTILLGTKTSGRAYSVHDQRFLEVLTSEAAIATRNAQLFEEKNQRVHELEALNKLAFSLGTDTELDPLLEAALKDVVAVTGADSGSIMLLDRDRGELTIAAALGIQREVVRRTRVKVGTGVAGWVAQHRKPLILVGDTDPRFAGELSRDDIVSAVSAPVMRKDVVIGVINVNRKVSGHFFTRENLNVVTSFAGQLGAAIENARLYTDLEKTFLGTITALAATVDAKDPYTFGHSNEVTAHAVAIAERLGLSEREIEVVRIGATLHDIGKIGIDRAVLHKAGKLDDEEWAHIRRHPAIGADILAPLDFLTESVPFVLFHHERYDGKGYPSGISGEAIPFGARIIAVADTFNAMTSDRPYRKALPLEIAISEIQKNSGTQFDPTVAEAFLQVLAEQEVARAAEQIAKG